MPHPTPAAAVPSPSHNVTAGRRGFMLAGAAALAGAASLSGASSQPGRMRSIRIAHLTDAHVQPERGAAEGLAACLEHAQDRYKPDLVVFGGDNVMNVDGASGAERAAQQLGVFNSVVRQHLSTDHLTVIGNHDILRMQQDAGKRWAMDAFGLSSRYYTHDRAGWRIIVLDSTEPQEGGGYKGRLDAEQFQWLADTLAATPETTPVAVVSHIPIFGACPFFDGDNEKSGNWVVPGAWMHLDARAIKDLFRKHPNVKVCLSGHIHLADRVDYLGVTYLCNGAVSGGWWGGAYQDFGPAYGVVDLYEDGSFGHQLVEYGWTPRQ